MEACPSCSETILGLTPSPSSNVAQVYLRSWKRVVEGTPARSSIRLNERLRSWRD
jgi:hypothetical protein